MIPKRISTLIVGLVLALSGSAVLAESGTTDALTVDDLLSKEFKPGFMALNADRELNFFLNRLAWSIPETELKEVGGRVHSIDDWVPEMIAAARSAESGGRLMHAANFWKAAEFYMMTGADKRKAYERFIELHDKALPEIAMLRQNIPYDDGFLPVIDLPFKGAYKGTILIHSGYDGLVEELILPLGPLTAAGYRVIAFEGPGQGGVVRLQGIPMPYEWEKPVGAILDYYNIENCTLVGMSLGGYLAPRAAAFDSRIKRVVAWGAMYDLLDVGRQDKQFSVIEKLVRSGDRERVNALFQESNDPSDLKAQLAASHGLLVSGGKDIYDFYRWGMKMNLRDVAQLIKQDVLIVMGTQDHLVPPEQAWLSAKAMTNARSVSVRMVTEKEQGAEHCQIGNPTLVVHEMLDWLRRLERRDTALEDPLPNLVTDVSSS